jgi:hypothetical protein
LPLLVELPGTDRLGHVLRFLAVDAPIVELDPGKILLAVFSIVGSRLEPLKEEPSLTSSYSTPESSSAFWTRQHGWPPNFAHMPLQRCSFTAI